MSQQETSLKNKVPHIQWQTKVYSYKIHQVYLCIYLNYFNNEFGQNWLCLGLSLIEEIPRLKKNKTIKNYLIKIDGPYKFYYVKWKPKNKGPRTILFYLHRIYISMKTETSKDTEFLHFLVF